MNVLTNIRRNRALRGAKSRPRSINQCWPNPQISVGRFITTIGSQKCWEAVGPARTVFLALGQDIKRYLDTYSEPTPNWVTWSIYMVGISPDTAVPTIIFCCESETYRKTIRNTIRESHLLDRHPAIALKHLPRAPDYNQLVQLAAHSEIEASENASNREVSAAHPCVFSTASRPSLGHPLLIRTSEGSVAFRKATAGGVISINGKGCLMSAAHAFTGQLLEPSRAAQHDLELCFSDSDDDVDATSQASYSSGFSSLEDGEQDVSSHSSRSSGVSAPFDHQSHDSVTPFDTYSSSNAERSTNTNTPSEADVEQLPQNFSLVGNLVFSSFDSSQPELDYALIQLNEDVVCGYAEHQTVCSKILSYPNYPEPEDLQHLTQTPVVAYTASAGMIRGRANFTPIFLRTPNARHYQEVYQAVFEKCLAIGDCGSWVCDPVSGILYGHVIAGAPAIGMAYFVPSHRVFSDIQQHIAVIEQRLDQRHEVFTSDTTMQPAGKVDPCSIQSWSGRHTVEEDNVSSHSVLVEETHASKDTVNPTDGSPISSIPLAPNNAITELSSAYGQLDLQHNSGMDTCLVDDVSADDNYHTPDVMYADQRDGPTLSSSTVQGLDTSDGDAVIDDISARFRELLKAKRLERLELLRQSRTHNTILLDGASQTETQTSGNTDGLVSSTRSLHDLPLFPVQPTSNRSVRFGRMVQSLSDIPVSWENSGLLDEALRVVPLEQIYNEAEEKSRLLQAEAESLGDVKKPAWGYQDCVIRALLRWFKRSFFSWVNNPPCSVCYSPTEPCGTTAPLPDEQAQGAIQVEDYQCTSMYCRNHERFPRYNNAFVLLRTRRGRNGEWTTCFGMLCRAIGSRVRWIWNAEDHVWIEVYSAHRKRWVHIDPCEEAWDTPSLYTAGWGEHLSYCFAFSVDGVTDVTARYVRDPRNAAPRNRCSEAEVLGIMEKVRDARRKNLSTQQKETLKQEDAKENAELRRYMISEIAAGICSLRLEQLDGGTVKFHDQEERGKAASRDKELEIGQANNKNDIPRHVQ